jgi:hypothetical protein
MFLLLFFFERGNSAFGLEKPLFLRLWVFFKEFSLPNFHDVSLFIFVSQKIKVKRKKVL